MIRGYQYKSAWLNPVIEEELLYCIMFYSTYNDTVGYTITISANYDNCTKGLLVTGASSQVAFFANGKLDSECPRHSCFGSTQHH